jgi:hypothetical protein
MEVAASGIGTAGTGLTYAWYQNGAALTDGGSVFGSATPTLTLNSLVGTNAGTYYVTVTGATGTPVQSSNAVVSVITTPTAPTFTLEPVTNTTVSEGATVTFSAQAVGTGPISYAWYTNLTTPVQVGSSSNLTLPNLATNQSGVYYCVATGGTGLSTTSTVANLTVTGPVTETIGYLRSLLNTTTYQPANTTTLFTITGVVTTATNLTSGNTSSCYIQDATGGINLFVTDGSDFRPALGDVVTATGTLSSFEDNLELDVTEGAADYVDTILSHNSPEPTPILLPWGNNVAPLSAFISTNVEGSVVVMTNLYFEAYTPTAVFASGGTYTITNTSGQTFTVYVSDQDTNFIPGQKIPQFAYSIAAPLIQVNTTIGLEFTVFTNLVTAAPPAVTIGGGLSFNGGTKFTLNWTAVPNIYTYTVLSTTNLNIPFTPLASGLFFTTTNGTFTDLAPTNVAKFYAITTP